MFDLPEGTLNALHNAACIEAHTATLRNEKAALELAAAKSEAITYETRLRDEVAMRVFVECLGRGQARDAVDATTKIKNWASNAHECADAYMAERARTRKHG